MTSAGEKSFSINVSPMKNKIKPCMCWYCGGVDWRQHLHCSSSTNSNKIKKIYLWFAIIFVFVSVIIAI